MNLSRARCEELLAASDHGVLATRHPDRGADAVPVCFAVEGIHVVVPIDLVKPKSSPALQRQRNLDADPRAVMLCEHWDTNDWSQLWWVRASMTRIETGEATRRDLGALLGEKYPQYEHAPFADLIVFAITGLSGWSGEV
jgi:PPOX class probable F420-dependent enzyme